MTFNKTLGRALAGGLVAIAGLASTTLATHAETYAVIVKTVNDVFSAPIKDGCEAAATELGVECYYIGPSEVNEAAQIQVINDVLARGVDGIAISATNPASVARLLQRAQSDGIPIVTFDGDLLEADTGLRSAFIGTDNYQFGVELAKKVVELKPSGGSVCIQTGTAGSLNLDLRVQGIRDTLGGGSKDAPVSRLENTNGWTEVAACPIYNNDNIALSAQQLNDVLTANPDLDAFIAVGGWAQYAPAAYRAAVERVKDRVDAKELVISFGDAFEPQLPLLKDGLSHYQVGQNPYQMGFQSVQALKTLHDGGTVDSYIDTGFVLCTPEQADTCGKN